jgi:hypothetical protein
MDPLKPGVWKALRLDRGVGRDPAVGRPKAVTTFETPAVALRVPNVAARKQSSLDRMIVTPLRTTAAAAASILLPATYEHLIFGQRERIRHSE